MFSFEGLLLHALSSLGGTRRWCSLYSFDCLSRDDKVWLLPLELRLEILLEFVAAVDGPALTSESLVES